MILEAFSAYLHSAEPEVHARVVLCRWLWEKLSLPPTCQVDQVIQCEIVMSFIDSSEERDDGENGEESEHYRLVAPDSFRHQIDALNLDGRNAGPERNYVFSGASVSGERLLKSLDEFSLSYEHQKWARWVHGVKASDFKQKDI